MSELTNPAAQLYDLLKEWEVLPQGATPLNQRSEDGQWLPVHLRALEWLSAVRARMVGDADFENVLDRLAKGIFCGDIGIVGDPRSSPRRLFQATDLVTLKMLARNWGHGNVRPAAVGEFTAVTEGIRELIDPDELGADAARYLFELTKALDKAVDEFAVFGPDRVRALANELVGALLLHFGDLSEEDQEKAGGFVRKLADCTKALFGFVAGKAVEVGAEEGLKAITSGL